MCLRPVFARIVTGLWLAAAGAGCAPLTFANEASVEFERYPSVSLQLAGPDGSQRHHEYLERELREHSGFQRISAAGESASAQLLVELTLDWSTDIDLFEEEDDLDIEVSYSATVHYRLFAANGALLDSGLDTAEDVETSLGAAEQALDLVVLHYLRPYRL